MRAVALSCTFEGATRHAAPAPRAPRRPSSAQPGGGGQGAQAHCAGGLGQDAAVAALPVRPGGAVHAHPSLNKTLRSPALLRHESHAARGKALLQRLTRSNRRLQVCQSMASACRHPLIFPLSSDHPEVSPADALAWTEGRCLVTVGDGGHGPVELPGGRRVEPSQAAPHYVFPGAALAGRSWEGQQWCWQLAAQSGLLARGVFHGGAKARGGGCWMRGCKWRAGVGLGVFISEACKLKDEQFIAAAEAVARMVTAEDVERGALLPSLRNMREVRRRHTGLRAGREQPPLHGRGIRQDARLPAHSLGDVLSGGGERGQGRGAKGVRGRLRDGAAQAAQPVRDGAAGHVHAPVPALPLNDIGPGWSSHAGWGTMRAARGVVLAGGPGVPAHRDACPGLRLSLQGLQLWSPSALAVEHFHLSAVCPKDSIRVSSPRKRELHTHASAAHLAPSSLDASSRP